MLGDDAGSGLVCRAVLAPPASEPVDAAARVSSDVTQELENTGHGERVALSLPSPDQYPFHPGDGNASARLVDGLSAVSCRTRCWALDRWCRFACSRDRTLRIATTRCSLNRFRCYRAPSCVPSGSYPQPTSSPKCRGAGHRFSRLSNDGWLRQHAVCERRPPPTHSHRSRSVTCLGRARLRNVARSPASRAIDPRAVDGAQRSLGARSLHEVRDVGPPTTA